MQRSENPFANWLSLSIINLTIGAGRSDDLKKKEHFFLPGIFFISVASLGAEIVLTRLFTVAMGYPFAYLIISLALLGYGAAGAFLRVFPDRFSLLSEKRLVLCPALFSIGLILDYLLANQIPFDPVAILWDGKQLLHLFLILLLLLIPFFFSGLTLAACYTILMKDLGKCYFSDLTGAALGCLLPLILFYHAWDERILLILAACGFLSMFFFALSFHSRPLLSIIAVFICLIAIAAAPDFLSVRISPYSDLMTALRSEQSRIIKTEWNEIARMDLIESPTVRFAPGLSLRYPDPLPEQQGLTVDADHLQALTAISDGKMDFLQHLPSSLPYCLSRPERVFIYDFGGGQDILAACYFGVRQIDAGERNRSIISAFESFYAAQPQWPSFSSDGSTVQIMNIDGRRYLKSGVSYDLIVLPLVQTCGSSGSLFSTGEDYRFTIEAIKDYRESLTDNGILCISRYLEPVPAEAIKLPLTLILSLDEKTDAKKCLIAIRSWSTWTVLLKKSAFSQAEVKATRSFCDENGFDLIYCPGVTEAETNRYNQFAEPIYYQIWQALLDEGKRQSLVSQSLFYVSPATDDAPFYHCFFSWDRMNRLFDATTGSWRILIQGGFLTPVLFIESALLSFVLILLPVWVRKKEEKTLLSWRAKGTALIYFFMIGIGFMFLEITLISKLVILFDTTAFSMTVVMASLLLSSGLGSLWANRKLDRFLHFHVFILFLIVVSLFVYSLLLPIAIQGILPLSLAFRLLLTAALIFPLGFMMGMPYPLGLSLVGQSDSSFIPWALCANSCASVVSSSLAVLLALSFGYTRLIRLSAASYFIAGAFLLLFCYFCASPIIGTKRTSDR